MVEDASLSTKDHPFGLPNLCQYFSERSPHPMIAVEGTTCIVRHVNAAFLELAGATRDEMVGQPFALCVPEGESNGCVGLLDRVYRTGRNESLAEQKHGDASPMYWSYAVWPILGTDEHPVGVMIQVTDSTETAVFRAQTVAMNEALLISGVHQQELAEETEALNARLQAVIKEKEYFIAVLSHELRSPLNPVLLAASLLQQDQRLDPEIRETMQMIHRNVTVEARLIDDLLDVTRMERGKFSVDRRPVDLREVLERSVDACRPDIEADKLILEVDTGGGPRIVEGDAGRLQQVFSNLLRNAIKFTPAGGRIHLRCQDEGDSIMVRIRDTGAGMDADFIPRAFSAFEQGDRSLDRKAGLGLGLAICKTIVDLHGGSITAMSEGKGRGATFTVRLPALDPTHFISIAPEAPAVAELPVKPLRILVVEDHADTARLMRRLLAMDGHTVQLAGDIATGLNLSRSHEFDLLLSDLGLPDGTGVELMQTLRQEGSTLPGIALSGYGQDKDIAESRDAGFAAHLIKPVNARIVRETIAAVVGQSSASDPLVSSSR